MRISGADALNLALKVINVLSKFQGGTIGETVTIPDEPIKGVKLGGKRGDLQLLWTPRK